MQRHQLANNLVKHIRENALTIHKHFHLEEFIRSSTGRDRIKAVHHLAGGNPPHLSTLIALYHKYKSISILGKGAVQNIPDLMSDMVSDKAAQSGLEVWQELTSNYPECQIPLRLLNAAVRYKVTKGDKRVLFELPIEERNLLKQILEIE